MKKRVCAGAWTLLLFLSVYSSAWAQQPVSADYFGMHIHHAGSTEWPSVEFKSWRLWDADVAWPDLEPKPGEWHFDVLDRYVALAGQHHVQILLTMGLTPGWASSRPNEPSDYKPGNAALPRDMRDWRNYVRVVATRYRGKIHEYEIWNEANRKTAFSGDARQMAELTREAARILKQVDPSNIVVSASATAENGLPWFNDYLGYGAAKYIDVVSYHLYVYPDPPEAMVKLAHSVRRIMAGRGIANKPLWNTEAGWSKPKLFLTPEEAAAFVSRAYLLCWASGVQRFYWYAWDNHNWVTLEMTDRLTHRPTPAAAACSTTRSWILGSTMRSCDRKDNGAWVCALNRGNIHSWIVWNPSVSTSFRIPASWHVNSSVTLSGATKKIAGGSTWIGISPVLLH